MKIFTTSQVRELDRLTIEKEPILSIDLIERAADALFERFNALFDPSNPVYVFAGPGNNGGDALALARKLLHAGYEVDVQLLHTGKLSPDCEQNRVRLLEVFPDSLVEAKCEFFVPGIAPDTIIVDGLFGSGLSRSLEGVFADAVRWINGSGCTIVSIDIPSGLQGEENVDLLIPIVKSSFTFSLQFPKLAFLLPETGAFAGEWSVLNIGIHPTAIVQTSSSYHFQTKGDIAVLVKKRSNFSHKGTCGHALIIAGSRGMAGASVLAARAALRSGCGLVTVHGPGCNRVIVQTAVPEAIYHSDKQKSIVTAVSDLAAYHSVGVGPGIRVVPETLTLLDEILTRYERPCVLDADALNLLATDSRLLSKIPTGSILTPHPKEFDRMFGSYSNTLERIKKASDVARQLQIVVVLKGTYTAVGLPNGELYFNSTGNSGMATAGSGDVLTGILSGLLAQGYPSEDAARLGVYLHGLAADLALEHQSEESLMAGDIIHYLGAAFRSLQS